MHSFAVGPVGFCLRIGLAITRVVRVNMGRTSCEATRSRGVTLDQLRGTSEECRLRPAAKREHIVTLLEKGMSTLRQRARSSGSRL